MTNKDESPSVLPSGAFCNHEAMTECCEGCGHFHCPSCGLSWDDFAEGGGQDILADKYDEYAEGEIQEESRLDK